MLQNKNLVFDLDNTLYYAGKSIENLVDAKIIDFFAINLHISLKEAQQLMNDIRCRYFYEAEAMEKDFPFSKYDFLEYVCDVDVSQLHRNDELNLLLANLPQCKFILTDSTLKHVRDVLQATGIDENNFSGIFDAHDMNYTFKYNPRSYESFLQKFCLKAEDCVMFEDNIRNLEVAKSLGFVTVMISPEHDREYAFVDYRFNDINSALRYLNGLNKNF